MPGRIRGHPPTTFKHAPGRPLVLGLLLLGACAPPSAHGPVAPVRRVGYDELQRYAGFSVYQVVERAFPSVLRARPLTTARSSFEEQPQVYVGGRWFGDLTILHDIPITSVLELRFLTSMEAAQRYGRESPRGAIEVVLRP